MAHNRLRRDLEAALLSACPNIADNTEVQSLLLRALAALGGPVSDHQPEHGVFGVASVETPYSPDLATAIGGPLTPAASGRVFSEVDDSEAAGDNAASCGAPTPLSPGLVSYWVYRCTQKLNHTGPHRARGVFSERIYAEWPREPRMDHGLGAVEEEAGPNDMLHPLAIGRTNGE